MCGIAGSTIASAAVLASMRDRLRHRGPDGTGLWQNEEGGPGLTHTRLAVIDLSPAAAQPMTSDCGRYVLSFNGEIYNYLDLRAQLESKGEQFRSDSDTEVLLVLLRREGTQALGRLVGMFAFALWDREKKEMLLVRDRLGIKPLVYAPLSGGNLAFASEIHALKAHPGIDLGVDREALSEFLACLYVPAPKTIHRGIRKLPPGQMLRWRDGKFQIERYWRPQFTGGRQIKVAEAVEELLPAIRLAVVDRMVADVPIGCFLSGGIDSSVIAALMAENARRQGGRPINTFTMTFNEAAYDERHWARRVADDLGSNHTELAAGAGLTGLLDDTVSGFGEPFGNPTALLIHDLSRRTREYVTVALAGDGGDEVFAGYPRYRGGLLAARYRRLPDWLRGRVVEPLSRFIPESTRGRHSLRRVREFVAGANYCDSEMYASWVEYFDPAERHALLGGDGARPERPIAELYEKAPSSQPLDAMQQTDLLSFLPGNLLAYGDAMSMRHGLELRLPLIDHRVIEAVQRLSPELRFQGGMKTLLKAVARRLLPASVVDRRKRGFNPPMGVWLKNDLADLVAERLTPKTMASAGLAWEPVARLLDEQRNGRRDHSLKIWSLLVLDAWRTAQ